jgi:hypothetical protein
MRMRAYGHVSVWRTHLGLGRTTNGQHWYQQLRHRWTAHQASRQQATLDALHRGWDAQREAVRPRHADAAIDMALAQGAFSLATHPIALAV